MIVKGVKESGGCSGEEDAGKIVKGPVRQGGWRGHVRLSLACLFFWHPVEG